MKKVLLSSIIVFGVCSFVSAQSSDLKTNKRTTVVPSITAAPSPQKSASTTDVNKTKADGTAATPANEGVANDLNSKPSTSEDMQAAKEKKAVKAPAAKKSKGQ